MRRLVSHALLATGGAVAAVALAASTAFAAVWTVSGNGGAGGAVGGDAGITTLTVDDTAHSGSTTTLTCQSSHTNATVPNGNSNGSPIGTINSLSFTSCNFGGFFSFTVSTSGTPWNLNAVSQPGGPGTDVNGTITGTIRAHISGPGCEADIAGSSVPGVYSNTNEDLNIPGTGQNLSIASVDPNNNCLGRLTAGDPSAFKGDYFVDQPLEVDLTG